MIHQNTDLAPRALPIFFDGVHYGARHRWDMLVHESHHVCFIRSDIGTKFENLGCGDLKNTAMKERMQYFAGLRQYSFGKWDRAEITRIGWRMNWIRRHRVYFE
jgi:hypothetical protein